MYSSQFDGPSLFSGAGFMPSQPTQSIYSDFSPPKNRSSECLLPLTEKQISDAYESNDNKFDVIIDGIDVNHITLVGMVMNNLEKVTDVNVSLDDETGRLDVHRWVNDAAESNEMAAVNDGMYVRVHGQLKGCQGKKRTVAFSVRRVTDFNEVANHFIECVYVHQYSVQCKIAELRLWSASNKSRTGYPFKELDIRLSFQINLLGI